MRSEFYPRESIFSPNDDCVLRMLKVSGVTDLLYSRFYAYFSNSSTYLSFRIALPLHVQFRRLISIQSEVFLKCETTYRHEATIGCICHSTINTLFRHQRNSLLFLL